MSEEIDSRKSSRESFLSHLEKSADKVRTWPEWKQRSLDTIGYVAKSVSSASPKNK